MHLLAVTRADAANHRFIAFGNRIKHIEIANAFAAEFGPKGYNIPTNELEAQPSSSKDAPVSNKKAREFLGIDFIDAKDQAIAMAQSLIDLGDIAPPK